MVVFVAAASASVRKELQVPVGGFLNYTLPPIMQNQMELKMENQLEVWIIEQLLGTRVSQNQGSLL